MNLKRQMLVLGSAVIASFTMAVSIASAQNNIDPSATSEDAPKTLTGAWRTVVTAVNCQTGQALASFPGLFTFNHGGTLSEYGINPGSSPALRSPGHGVWQRQPGWQNYSIAFTFYRYNPTGVFIGSQRVTAALRLGTTGDAFTTLSALEFLDANDQVVGTGCASAAGTRFPLGGGS